MICKECKKEISDGAVFCPNCGALIEEENLEDTCVLVEENETGLLDGNDEQETGLLNETPVADTHSYSDSHPVNNNVIDKNTNPAYINPAFQQTGTQNNIQNTQHQPQRNVVNVQTPYNNPNQIQYSAVNTPNQNYSYQNQSRYSPNPQHPGNQISNPQYQPNQAPNPQFQPNKKFSYKEFYKAFASKKTKNAVSWVGIVCIFTTVVSFGIFGMYGSPLSIIDILFYGVFSILILKLKKWQVILPVCIYSGVFSIIGMVLTSTPSGILAVVMSIIAVVKAKKFDDAYKHYSMTNQFPVEKI